MYTKAQKRFWFTLVIVCLLLIYMWYEIFSKPEIGMQDIVRGVVVVTVLLVIMHWWGIRITRTGNFWSRSFGSRKHPASCESWDTVQKGVPGVNILLFLVPVTFAWLLKILL